jgi:hypothetical protein
MSSNLSASQVFDLIAKQKAKPVEVKKESVKTVRPKADKENGRFFIEEGAVFFVTRNAARSEVYIPPASRKITLRALVALLRAHDIDKNLIEDIVADFNMQIPTEFQTRPRDVKRIIDGVFKEPVWTLSRAYDAKSIDREQYLEKTFRR